MNLNEYRMGLPEVAQTAIHEMIQDPQENQVLADKLGIPEKTLDNRLVEINRFLGTGSMRESIIMVLDHGIEQPPELESRDILAIHSLSPNEFTAAVGHARGMSRRAIVNELGVSVWAINRRMDRATRKLGHANLPRVGIRNAIKVWTYCHNIMGAMNPLTLPTQTLVEVVPQEEKQADCFTLKEERAFQVALGKIREIGAW